MDPNWTPTYAASNKEKANWQAQEEESKGPMNQEGVIARGWVLPRGASHVGGWATIKEVAKVRLEGILHCLQLLLVVQTARFLGKNRYNTCFNFFNSLHLVSIF